MEKEFPAKLSIIHYLCDNCMAAGKEVPMKSGGVQRMSPIGMVNSWICPKCKLELWIDANKLYPMLHIDVSDGKKGTILTLAGLQPRNSEHPKS
jgi:hypothetical protein